MSDPGTNKLLTEIQQAKASIGKGRRAEALLVYQEVAEQAGSNALVQYHLGQLCVEIGDVDQAIVHYEFAAAEAEDNAEYLGSLGIAYLNSGQPERATETLEKARSVNPDIPEVIHASGILHLQKLEYGPAKKYFERACELKPGNASMRINLATTLTRLNEHDEALRHARKAVRIDDANPRAHFALCSALTEIGQFDEATRHLQKTIRQHRTFGVAYDLLSRIKKFSEKDRPFIDAAEKSLKQGMSAKDRFLLHYALGKMHDDCGDHAQAFTHYEQANLLQKSDLDISRQQKLARDMKAVFDRSSLPKLTGLSHDSALPVFVVGMPRSGTTLIEQMIASHPDAAGAGELPDFPRLAAKLFPEQDKRKAVAKAAANLNAENCNQHAGAYLDALRYGRQDASRIVDKMPSNFFFVGLIVTIFPNATIIHSQRNPLDTCLSCYFQSFSDLPWTNDFSSIAKMYAVYRDIMDHWYEVLPEGTITDIHYEQLVDDPEGEGRRMLEACGLPWNDAVTEFFREKNIVKTASIAQVRQPIYKTSKMRWMNYASKLHGLAADLSPYLQDDRELLDQHGIALHSRSRGWLRKIGL